MKIERLWTTLEEQVACLGKRMTCDSPGCPHTSLWVTDLLPGMDDWIAYCDGHKYLAEEQTL